MGRAKRMSMATIVEVVMSKRISLLFCFFEVFPPTLFSLYA
jgi:hypothetical protein